MKEIRWEEVGISNDFMFGKIMRDSELCRELLEAILEVKIDRVEYPEEQKVINMTADARSVRLDVYVKDGLGTVYDIEMQATDTKELPKRSRYYQGMIDLELIEKGESYRKLNTSFVIFICTFDLFGKGRHKYTFENRCCEDEKLRLEDGTQKIFLNAMGTQDDVNEDLRAFLSYVAGRKSDNSFVRKLDDAVQRARKNQEWRREFMTLLMRDQENIEKGRAEGLAEGRAEGRTEGLAEGRSLGRNEMIVEMLRNDIPAEKIARVAGVSVEEILEIGRSAGILTKL